MRAPRDLRFRDALVPALLVAALVAASGCYRRVVRADGTAEEFYEVHEPNYKPTVIEKALEGEPSKSKSKTRNADP